MEIKKIIDTDYKLEDIYNLDFNEIIYNSTLKEDKINIVKFFFNNINNVYLIIDENYGIIAATILRLENILNKKIYVATMVSSKDIKKINKKTLKKIFYEIGENYYKISNDFFVLHDKNDKNNKWVEFIGFKKNYIKNDLIYYKWEKK